MDHARNPRNKGVLSDADMMWKGSNPSCGDSITFFMKWNKGVLTDVRFDGNGCAVSQAGASLLTEKVKGMSRAEIEAVTDKNMYELLKVEIHGSREKCALLALATLREALANDPE